MPDQEADRGANPTSRHEMPRGIPYIVGNEAAERFSFYGMKAILVVFMTKFLMDWSGQRDVMTEPEAKSYYHLFVASAYFFRFSAQSFPMSGSENSKPLLHFRWCTVWVIWRWRSTSIAADVLSGGHWSRSERGASNRAFQQTSATNLANRINT